jgi:hypothetical protein
MKVNTSDAHKAGVSERVRQLLAERDNPLPVWVRAPKHGHEHYCGFSRAKLYEGAAKGHFRSASIREPGQVKGTRLFHLGSILAFIERCETSAESRTQKREISNSFEGQSESANPVKKSPIHNI